MKHVFISYQHEDGDFADVLIHKVKEAGFSTWIDNDQMQAGADWRESIDKAIKASCALIVIMSPAAKSSEYVTYEWAFAWGAGIKVIPVLYKQTSLHPRLSTLHHLNFTRRNARPWGQLIDSVKHAANAPATTVQSQTPAYTNPVQKTPEKLLETGDILYGIAAYDKALTAYEEAFHLTPDNAYIQKKIGDTLMQQAQYTNALVAYNQAVRLKPDYVEAYLAQCEPLIKLKRHKDALEVSEHVLRLDSGNAVAYNMKGNALLALSQYEEALAAYVQAIRLDANYAFAYNNKGNALNNLKRYEDALVAYEQAIHLNPNYALAYYNMSGVLANLRRYEDALAAYDQSVHLDPTNGDPNNLKPYLLRVLGKK